MQQADEILEVLNEKLGGTALSWKGDHASLKIEGQYVVDLIKIDAQTVELVSLIRTFESALNPALVTKLLAANYQGTMTGAARIALTPDEKLLALTRRIDVRGIDTALLEEILGDFINYVKFWSSDDVKAFFKEELESDKGAGLENPDFIVSKV
ncbi:MAG: type III secretion system chaperone [Pseudomonadota bacterium]